MPCSSTWMALVSWPPMSSTVRVRGNIAWAPRPWQRISERICSFGEGQALAAVAGADARRSARARAPTTRVDRRRASAGSASGRPRSAAAARAASKRPAASAEFSTSRIALSKRPASRSKRDARGARLLLGEGQVAAAGEVAEEVALAARALRRRARRPRRPSARAMRSTMPRPRAACVEQPRQEPRAARVRARASCERYCSRAEAPLERRRSRRGACVGLDAALRASSPAISEKRVLISASLSATWQATS